MSEELLLTDLAIFTEPFPYFTAAQGFGESVSLAILDWLETDAPWQLVEADFYEQYEISLLSVSLPPRLQFLMGRPFLDALRAQVERIFRIQLG